MPHQTFNIKKLIVAFILVAVAGSTTNKVYAAVSVDSDYTKYCAAMEQKNTWGQTPSPMAIICPVVRLLNAFVLSAGVFFVLFIFFAAIKYALAQGDPKALQASKQTLTAALVGFLIVIGVYTIVLIIKNVLGLRDNPIVDPFGALSDNIAKFLVKIGVDSHY